MTDANNYQQKIVNNFFQNCGKSSNVCVHTQVFAYLQGVVGRVFCVVKQPPHNYGRYFTQN